MSSVFLPGMQFVYKEVVDDEDTYTCQLCQRRADVYQLSASRMFSHLVSVGHNQSYLVSTSWCLFRNCLCECWCRVNFWLINQCALRMFLVRFLIIFCSNIMYSRPLISGIQELGSSVYGCNSVQTLSDLICFIIQICMHTGVIGSAVVCCHHSELCSRCDCCSSVTPLICLCGFVETYGEIQDLGAKFDKFQMYFRELCKSEQQIIIHSSRLDEIMQRKLLLMCNILHQSFTKNIFTMKEI